MGAWGTNSFPSRGHGSFSLGSGNHSQRFFPCRGCNNHIVETYFRKHGYPQGYHYKSLKPYVNNVTGSTALDNSSETLLDSHNSLATIRPQYNQLLQMLQHHKSSPLVPTPQDGSPFPNVNLLSIPMDGKPPIYRVIDTGATYYITPNVHNFHFHCYVPPIHMKLPNGTTILTDIVCTVHLSNPIILPNVYYISTFHVNLIFATKIIEYSGCTLPFTNKECFILLENSTIEITMSFKLRPLFLSPFSFFLVTLFLTITIFWHTRLGH